MEQQKAKDAKLFAEVEARLSTFLDPFKRLEIIRSMFDLGANPKAQEPNFANVYEIFDQFDKDKVDQLSTERYEFIGKCLVDENYNKQRSDTVNTRTGSFYLQGVGGGMDAQNIGGNNEPSADGEEQVLSQSAKFTNTSQEMGAHYDEYMAFEGKDDSVHDKMKKKLQKKQKA